MGDGLGHGIGIAALDHQNLDDGRLHEGRRIRHFFNLFLDGWRRLDDQVRIAANEAGGVSLREQGIHPLDTLGHHSSNVLAVARGQFEAS